MKKTLLFSTLILITICSKAFAKDSRDTVIKKIGMVNPVAIYQSAPQGQQSLQALQEKLKPQADKLQAKQNSLMQDKQKLHNDASVMTPDELKQNEAQQMEKENQFQQAFTAFRQSAAEQEQKLAQNFQEAFNTAVSEVAEKQGYDLILSSQAIAYVAQNAKNDITDQVVKEMNSLGKTSKDSDKKSMSLYNKKIAFKPSKVVPAA